LTDYVTQLTSSVVAATHLGDAYSCASYLNGAGWRFKVAGSIGDITATSYTYFNLSETDVSTTYCPAVGKSGTLSISAASCAPAFTEEYITLEGFSLGCATIDVGVSITCDGFADATFVAKDIAIGSWLELDFGITFTTTSKSTDFCLTATLPGSDCFTIELGLDNSSYVTDTTIPYPVFHGIGFTYSWNGISFTSYTELDAYSALFSGATAWSYLDSSTQNLYLVPYTGRSDACTATATYFTYAAGWKEPKCVVTERYKLWEKFIVDIDADACCGGALDLTISTWFGDNQVLDYVAYDVILDGEMAPDTTIGMKYPYQKGTTSVATATTALTTAVTHDTVNYKTGYVAGTETTLFDWAKTEVDASIGVASNITLDLGFNVSAFGWESLEVGFTFIF